jgi:hypothetical protein
MNDVVLQGYALRLAYVEEHPDANDAIMACFGRLEHEGQRSEPP